MSNFPAISWRERVT